LVFEFFDEVSELLIVTGHHLNLGFVFADVIKRQDHSLLSLKNNFGCAHPHHFEVREKIWGF
jgi:hypothetical protein